MNPVTHMMNPRVAAIRAEDQAPLQELIHAIGQAHRNALVVCEDDLVLDAIGVQLARALRRLPHLHLELYQPSSTESLLARFNGMVADLPLHAAQAVLQPHERLRVWVLHLTQQRDLADVQLLLRLVQGFPGAGVRLLLLLSQEVASDRSLASLGPRVHRWDVECDGGPQRADGVGQWSDAVAQSQSGDPVVADRGPGAESKQTHEPERAPAVLHRLRLSARRVLAFGGAARSRAARAPVQATQRWMMGLFGLALLASGSLAAWWHAKPAVGSAAAPASSRAVPEILEYVDSRAALRPSAVRVGELSP